MGLIIGLISRAIYHVPAPLTLLQILGIELLVLLYPASVLSRAPSSRHSHLHFDALLFGMIAACIAYGSFLLTFVWHGISPVSIDTAHQLFQQATTVALVGLGLCQLTNLLLVRSSNRGLLTIGLWHNRQLVRALAVAGFLLLNVSYNPVFQAVFGTAALQPVDWLTIAIGLSLYMGFRRLQHHTHRHSRHVVLELHREIQES